MKGIDKFNSAGGRKGWLSPAEFVAAAPPQAKRKGTCNCEGLASAQRDNNDD